MTRRIINKELLRARVKEIGLEALAYKAEVSASLLQKLVSDSYQAGPSIRTIDGICKVTGDKMSELFPILQDEEEAS